MNFRLTDVLQQRAEKGFLPQIVGQWKSNDRKAINSYQQLLEIYEKLNASDDTRLRESQSQFQNALVSDLLIALDICDKKSFLRMNLFI